METPASLATSAMTTWRGSFPRVGLIPMRSPATSAAELAASTGTQYLPLVIFKQLNGSQKV